VTNDLVTGSANVYKTIDYPNQDIEGLWTYIYISYSRAQRRVVGMLQNLFGTVQTVDFEVFHPVPTALRFILGGADV
jgi:hypothetical protein